MIAREQLELAALAAGHAEARYEDWPGMEMRYGYARSIWTGEGYINPAEDDVDAARLCVKLQMDVKWGRDWVAAARGLIDRICRHDGTETEKLRAWREAVTLCAAAVGERMRGER